MVQRYIPNIPNAVETILTGPSLSLDLPRIDDFLKGSSENAEKRFMRMGITPEGMLNVKNTPSTNTSNTYENTSSSVVNDFKLAIKYWEKCLELNSTHINAKKNIEKAKRKIEELENK